MKKFNKTKTKINMEILQYAITIMLVLIVELTLSLDNTIIISMVANKAEPQYRDKVVKYGIIGAFIFRGLSLFIVSWVMSNPEFGGMIKLVGGFYLMKLGYEIISPQVDSIEEGEDIQWLDKLLNCLKIPLFVGVIIRIECIDYVYAIDNLLSAIAFTENIKGEYNGIKISLILTILGVFLGIIVMRWVTVRVMKLIEKYPSLEKSAGIVIVLLGFKLLISSILTLLEKESLTFFKSIVLKLSEYSDVVRPVLENHYTDFVFSAIMMGIFAYPVIFKKK